MDRKCLEQRPEHLQKTVPEGNRQRTAAGLFTDAALIGAAWPFNLTTDVGPQLGRAVHVWQVNGICMRCSLAGVTYSICCQQSCLPQFPLNPNEPLVHRD